MLPCILTEAFTIQDPVVILHPSVTAQIIERGATRTASRKASQLETAAHPAPPPSAGVAVA